MFCIKHFWQNYSKSKPETLKNESITKKTLRSFGAICILLLLPAIEPGAIAGTYPASGLRKIIIDAGHGGSDPGNLGTGRYKNKEKHISLKVALLAGKMIEENLPGVEVIYTRTTDKSVELHERTNMANKEKADMFISIHCDAFTSSSAYGSSSYVMGKDHGDENIRVAQRENSVIFLEDNYEENYEGFDPSRPETYIALTLYQNHFQYQSISLAQKIQDQFTEYAKRKDRGVKQQPLWVTSRAVMPAVLVELGFLTNSTEEDYLNSANGQNKMAESIFKAVYSYKQEIDQLESVNEADERARLEEVQRLKEQEEMEIASRKVDWRVQVRTSANDIPLDDPYFKGYKEVSVYKSGQNFKYTIGHYDSYEKARDEALLLRNKGFEGAFVVAFRNQERIDIQEAREASR